MDLKHFTVSSAWLHADRLEQLDCSLLSGIGDRGHLERGMAAVSDSWLAGVAHDSGEFVEERAKALGG